jgi:hypothetical protein
MKVKLRIRKQATLYEAVHAITDAESFGRASADVWVQMRNRWLQKAASIGNTRWRFSMGRRAQRRPDCPEKL